VDAQKVTIMRKYAFTIFWLLVFAAMLVWVATQERGRVPEKEEILAHNVMNAGGINSIEAVKYTYEEVASEDEQDEGGESAGEEAAEDTNEATGENADNQENSDETKAAKEEKPKRKRVVDRRLRMEKRDDDWYLVEPVEGMVDPDKADDMVEAIERLKPDVREHEDATAEKYGLAEPKMVITAGLEEGGQLEIALGEDTPVGAKVYGRISGRKASFCCRAASRATLIRNLRSSGIRNWLISKSRM
jgi:hypothetical protein